MSLIETKTGRKYFRKAESMMLVPYVYDDSAGVNDYVLGRDVYDISAVIGDSITIEQEDEEVEEKFNEFVSMPILQNVSAGSYKFSAQCLDLQDSILKALFGAYMASDVAVLPDDYQLQYAMIRIRFKDASLSDIILPKVQMNSKLLLQQMMSRGSQGNINGTALPRMIAVIDESSVTRSVMEFLSPTREDAKFAPLTSVIFVPRGYTPMVMHHKLGSSGDKYIFSTVDFSTGVTKSNCSVDISTGEYEILS